jgi:hypothetical protein
MIGSGETLIVRGESLNGPPVSIAYDIGTIAVGSNEFKMPVIKDGQPNVKIGYARNLKEHYYLFPMAKGDADMLSEDTQEVIEPIDEHQALVTLNARGETGKPYMQSILRALEYGTSGNPISFRHLAFFFKATPGEKSAIASIGLSSSDAARKRGINVSSVSGQKKAFLKNNDLDFARALSLSVDLGLTIPEDKLEDFGNFTTRQLQLIDLRARGFPLKLIAAKGNTDPEQLQKEYNFIDQEVRRRQPRLRGSIESKVFELMVDEASNIEIAKAVDVSTHTAKSIQAELLARFRNRDDRADLLLKAHLFNYVKLPKF